MSSYGNRCYTPERELITRRLVLAAMNLDDFKFEMIIDEVLRSDGVVAVAALLAEQLAQQLTDGIEYEDHDAYEADVAEAARPIKARIAELEQELGMRAVRPNGFGKGNPA